MSSKCRGQRAAADRICRAPNRCGSAHNPRTIGEADVRNPARVLTPRGGRNRWILTTVKASSRGFDDFERQGFDFRKHERQLKAEIEEGYRPEPGVAVEEVGLQGSYPDTVLFLIFRSERRPGHRFRYEFQLWDEHPSNASTSVIVTNFEEAVVFQLHRFKPV
jgi:hypothetical protein